MKPKLFFGLMLAFLWGCSEGDKPIQPQEVSDNSSIEFIEPEPDSVIVNEHEVQRVVTHILKDLNKRQVNSRACSQQTIMGADNKPIAYAINFGNNEGFVIVSATKKLEPILAFSEDGCFDADNIEGLIEQWLEKLFVISQSECDEETKIDMARKWNEFEKAHVPSFNGSRGSGFGYEDIRAEDWEIIHNIMKDSLMSWHTKYYDVYTLDDLEFSMPEKYEEFDEMARNAVWPEYEQGYKNLTVVIVRYDGTTNGGHMMKTKWNQIYPYNQSFTNIPGINYTPYAGCGPVALGQILYYHKHPTNKNWADMPLESGNKTISDFLLEICQIGEATPYSDGMVLKPSGVDKVLNYYGYNRDYATSSNKNFDALAKKSLSNGRPVYVMNEWDKKVDGNVVKSEHAYVLDGSQSFTSITSYEVWSCPNKKKFEPIHEESKYSDSAPYYHINWGWGDQNDDYYINWLTAVPNSNFNNNHTIDMFYNIRPK